MKKILVKLFVVVIFSFCIVFIAEGTSNANVIDRGLCSTNSQCPPGMCCSFDLYCTYDNSDCM